MTRVFSRRGFVSDQLPAILWALLIFVASSIPNVTLPDLKFAPSDKIIHTLAYAVLCGLIERAFARQTKFPRLASWRLGVAVLLTIIYGVTDEFHQSFVPNRDASVLDLVADSLGGLLFVGYVVASRRWSRSAIKRV